MNGYSAEQIREHYPHLSLAQIYAALSYYYDHKAEIDAEIEKDIQYAAEARAKHPNRLTRDELVARIRGVTGDPDTTGPNRVGDAPSPAVLTGEHKNLLVELYFSRSPTVDDLAYSEEMDEIYKEFVRQTGLALTVRDVFRALKNLGRQGRLGGKLRSS
jgi:hypothetical protein